MRALVLGVLLVAAALAIGPPILAQAPVDPAPIILVAFVASLFALSIVLTVADHRRTRQSAIGHAVHSAAVAIGNFVFGKEVGSLTYHEPTRG